MVKTQINLNTIGELSTPHYQEGHSNNKTKEKSKNIWIKWQFDQSSVDRYLQAGRSKYWRVYILLSSPQGNLLSLKHSTY